MCTENKNKAINNYKEISVNDEFNKEYRIDIDSFRRKQQRRKHCTCPKQYGSRCNMDCLTCKYYYDNDSRSLDDPAYNDSRETNADRNKETTDMLIRNFDYETDLRISVSNVINRLPNFEAQICNLIMYGYNNSEIAAILSVSEGTIRYRLKKLRYAFADFSSSATA